MFSDMIFSPAKKIRKKFLKTCGLLEKETLYIVFQEYMKAGVLMQTSFFHQSEHFSWNCPCVKKQIPGTFPHRLNTTS